MFSIILVIFLLVTLAMIGVVLMQRSEGGALGIGGGGGGGGGGGFLTGRGTANLLTRTTAILAACFMGLSVVLTILSGVDREGGSSVLDDLGGSEQLAPLAPLPAEEGTDGSSDSEPSAPSVPVQ
ncbi:MAG: preprotein translocase subunit SecG [Limibacillus sp.]|jgi:preprotein translocase subunit SecG